MDNLERVIDVIEKYVRSEGGDGGGIFDFVNDLREIEGGLELYFKIEREIALETFFNNVEEGDNERLVQIERIASQMKVGHEEEKKRLLMKFVEEVFERSGKGGFLDLIRKIHEKRKEREESEKDDEEEQVNEVRKKMEEKKESKSKMVRDDEMRMAKDELLLGWNLDLNFTRVGFKDLYGNDFDPAQKLQSGMCVWGLNPESLKLREKEGRRNLFFVFYEDKDLVLFVYKAYVDTVSLKKGEGPHFDLCYSEKKMDFCIDKEGVEKLGYGNFSLCKLFPDAELGSGITFLSDVIRDKVFSRFFGNSKQAIDTAKAKTRFRFYVPTKDGKMNVKICDKSKDKKFGWFGNDALIPNFNSVHDMKVRLDEVEVDFAFSEDSNTFGIVLSFIVEEVWIGAFVYMGDELFKTQRSKEISVVSKEKEGTFHWFARDKNQAEPCSCLCCDGDVPLGWENRTGSFRKFWFFNDFDPRFPFFGDEEWMDPSSYK